MKKTKSKFVVSAPLFYKILGGITLPLVILLATFMAMTLRREIESEVKRSTSQSELALKSITDEYIKIFSEADVPPQQQGKETLKEQAEFLKSKLELERVDLIHPGKEISLIYGKNPKGMSDPILAGEWEGLAPSLAAKRHGKPYYLLSKVKIFSKDQLIYGYIPFHHKNIIEPLVLITVFKTSLQEVIRKILLAFVLMFITTFVVGLAIAIRLTWRIVRPIQLINKACREMLNGNFGLQVDVHTGDELQTMAQNFNEMSVSIMVMKRQAEDSNPLTGLPGNKRITAELMRRIEDRRKFVYFHVDIDHFKAYNDAYGLGRGDDVLRRTGEILIGCATESGSDTFVGHQGGDDFVMILEPHVAEEAAQKMCTRFDAIIKEFYDAKALEQGYFIGEESRHEGFDEAELKRHSLMSISLAGVTNIRSDSVTYDEVLQGAVKVKKKVKKIPYSKFLIEEIRVTSHA